MLNFDEFNLYRIFCSKKFVPNIWHLNQTNQKNEQLAKPIIIYIDELAEPIRTYIENLLIEPSE